MSTAVAVPATSSAALTATCDGPGDATVLEPHREDWQRLFGRAANEPSCSFAWTAALCRSHVTTGEPIAVIRVERGNDPLLLTAVTTRRVWNSFSWKILATVSRTASGAGSSA